MSEPLVQARGVEKRFGRTVALRALDLDLEAGASLAVLGPNGAGKSTLLRLVAGLARPSAGELRIAGERAGRPGARARVGLIGHQTFLYPQLTARENLLFAARLHGVPEPGPVIARLLEEAGLAAVAERRAGSFSRGMAQRLAIARGLVHDPALLLLDEPWSGLDPRAAERLSARLAALRRAGRSVVLVSHDVSRAVALADRALVLAAGRVAARLPGPLDAGSVERAFAACSADPA